MTVEAENEALVRAYHVCFGSPDAAIVLEDLAAFCRAAETCAVPGDHDRTFLLLGRNEVWQRIARLSKLTEDQIYRLMTARMTRIEQTGETDD